MNTQRWLVLLVVGSIAAAIATRPLWLPALSGEPIAEEETDVENPDEPRPTPAPLPTPNGTAPQAGELMAAEGEAMMEEGAMMEDTSATAETALDGAGGPFILAMGDFTQIDALHSGEGMATIYQAPDGSRFVRLEPFKVTDAPDLRVALSSNPAPRTQDDLATASGFLDLGALESTQGAQNYDIPLNVRLEQFESVVIYDNQFNIIFTTAMLER